MTVSLALRGFHCYKLQSSHFGYIAVLVFSLTFALQLHTLRLAQPWRPRSGSACTAPCAQVHEVACAAFTVMSSFLTSRKMSETSRFHELSITSVIIGAGRAESVQLGE